MYTAKTNILNIMSKKKTNKLFTTIRKKINEINKINSDKIDVLFDNLDFIDNLSKEDIKKIYIDSLISKKTGQSIANKLNLNKKQNINKNLSCIKNNDITFKYKKQYFDYARKIAKKISIILNHPVTKTIITIGLSIAWFMMFKNYTTATVACFSKEKVAVKLDTAFYCVRMITAVVAFIWMCLELSNTVVKGDMRAIWYIVSKYIILIIAVVGYKSIFQLIDNFFNA